MSPEYQYLDALHLLVGKHDADPTPREDRTGTGTFSIFGPQWEYDLAKGFPILTTKRVFWRGVVAELLWMLSGSTNIKPLVDQDVHIWDEWADENGELGPVYGAQWRNWTTIDGGPKLSDQRNWVKRERSIDQIQVLLDNLRNKPNDRGHVVSAWNAAELDQMKLRPCHCLFQMYVDDGKLSCKLYQRSADIFLGVPFNTASYALLTHLIAREVGLGVGKFIHSFGDLHLYANHVEQAKEQLTRSPRLMPQLSLSTVLPELFDVTKENIKLLNYNPYPTLKGDVSV